MKTFSGRPASQHPFELESFITLLRDLYVKSYLEIGARHGDTFHQVMSALPVGSLGVAVDYPGALWGTQKSVPALRAACADLQKKGYEIIHFFGDSTHPHTVNFINGFKKFDAVLIDGDHTYTGVKKDWINYSARADIVALHDIVGHGQAEKVYGNKVEVPQFWEEIKPTLGEYREIIGADSKMGLGICLSR